METFLRPTVKKVVPFKTIKIKSPVDAMKFSNTIQLSPKQGIQSGPVLLPI
jgi:hypothetical protein